MSRSAIYDRCVKLDDEAPTVGILLCAAKNDAVVQMTLPTDNKTIIASKYELYLPSKKDLLKEINAEIERFDNAKDGGEDE